MSLLRRKESDFKRCPRCGRKTQKIADKCPSCGLIFSRLKFVTNKSAKVALRRGQKHKVINYAPLPKDVSKKRLALFCAFLGSFGAHRFYVGKKVSGYIFLFSFLIFITAQTISFSVHQISSYYTDPFSMPYAIVLVILVVDFFRIIFNKFKVPVSIPEEFNPEFNKVLDIVKDIDTSISKRRKEELKQQVRSEFLKTAAVKEPAIKSAADPTPAENGELKIQKPAPVINMKTINSGSKKKSKKKRKK